MWHLCHPTYEDAGSTHDFTLITDWTVPGVGEVGFNGPLESLSVHGSSLGFRFARTGEEREGHPGVDLPNARLVVTDSAVEFALPSRPPRRFLKPPMAEGFGLASVEWRSTTDEIRITASGMKIYCVAGLWHWQLDWDRRP